MEKEEESAPEDSKISSFSSSFPFKISNSDSEVEDNPFFVKTATFLLKKKGAKIDPCNPNSDDDVSPKSNGTNSHPNQKVPFGPFGNDAVSRPYQKAPQGPFRNDVISSTTRHHFKAACTVSSTHAVR